MNVENREKVATKIDCIFCDDSDSFHINLDPLDGKTSSPLGHRLDRVDSLNSQHANGQLRPSGARTSS